MQLWLVLPTFARNRQDLAARQSDEMDFTNASWCASYREAGWQELLEVQLRQGVLMQLYAGCKGRVDFPSLTKLATVCEGVLVEGVLSCIIYIICNTYDIIHNIQYIYIYM